MPIPLDRLGEALDATRDRPDGFLKALVTLRMTTPLAGAAGAASLARPRVGFLGTGWIGRHRLQAIVETGAVTVAAIADASPDAAAEAGKLAPEAALVASLDDLLDAGVDGVVIATPSAFHAEQCIRALERGAAVFCQKPLGRTAAEAQAVVEAARAADRLLAVDLSYRFTDGMRRIRELVRSGELGRVYAVDLVFHNAYGPDKAWFYDPALAGGGCVMDLGVHLVDLALWVLGFPAVADVSGTAVRRRRAARRPERPGRGLRGRDPHARDRRRRAARLLVAPAGRLRRASSRPPSTAPTAARVSATSTAPSTISPPSASAAPRARRLSTPPDAWGGRAAADWASRLAAGARFDPAAERLVDVARVLDRIYGR